MNKKMNNKGFSLVELIIVIAIMAVLIGVLAPQFLKYVQKSKVSVDIQNAEEIATAVNVAISDQQLTTGTSISGVASGAATVSNVEGLSTLPASKVDATQTWTVTYSLTDGVTKITLGSGATAEEIWPNSNPYSTAHAN